MSLKVTWSYLRVADWLVGLRHRPVVLVTTDATGAPVLGASLTVNMNDYD